MYNAYILIDYRMAIFKNRIKYQHKVTEYQLADHYNRNTKFMLIGI